VLYDAIREQIEESRRLVEQSRTLLHIGQAQVARSLISPRHAAWWTPSSQGPRPPSERDNVQSPCPLVAQPLEERGDAGIGIGRRQLPTPCPAASAGTMRDTLIEAA
jgi:hypothetical protein